MGLRERERERERERKRERERDDFDPYPRNKIFTKHRLCTETQ